MATVGSPHDAGSMQLSATPPNPAGGSSGEGAAIDVRRPAERHSASTAAGPEPADGTVPAPTSSPWSHSRQEAEVEDIVRALRRYGVLTRARLLDVCGAAHWSDTGARRAIAQAVASGRIRRLGDDLYEISEP
jgi:hypothetical protein